MLIADNCLGPDLKGRGSNDLSLSTMFAVDLKDILYEFRKFSVILRLLTLYCIFLLLLRQSYNVFLQFAPMGGCVSKQTCIPE